MYYQICQNGSREVYDNEAEKLAKLLDMFNELMQIILVEKEKQRKIVEQVELIEFPYKNILFKVYIQGKTLVRVADEMGYSYVQICRSHGTALNKFDEIEDVI